MVTIHAPDAETADQLALVMRVEKRAGATLLGDADDRLLASLRERAVPFSVHERPMQVGDATLSLPQAAVGDVIVAVVGPLTPERVTALTLAGAEVVEKQSEGRYRMRLRRPAAALAQLPWVAGVHSAAPTPTAVLAAARPDDTPAATYDVVLAAGSDPAALADALASLGARVLGTSRVKVRAVLDAAQRAAARALAGVRDIEPYVAPRYSNGHAGELIGSSDQGVAALGLAGAAQIVGVADSGVCRGHPGLAGAVLDVFGRAADNPSGEDVKGHGTHVCGSIAGSGAGATERCAGVAPEAKLFVQSLSGSGDELSLPANLGELFEQAYAQGARIHNNSWSADVAGRYTTDANDVDAFVDAHRDMLVVFAAGNRGTTAAPPRGKKLTKTGRVDLFSVGSPATAKNAIAVGAHRSSRATGGRAAETYRKRWPDAFGEDPLASELVSGDPTRMAGFSGRGPCRGNRRCKPDLVAPGTAILSCALTDTSLLSEFEAIPVKKEPYGFMSGTSMAAPIVAGAAALVRQYLVTRREHSPSAALLKAVLINGTRILDGADARDDGGGVPNAQQGFGALDLRGSLPCAGPERLAFVDNWQDAGEHMHPGDVHSWSLRVTEPCLLRVALVYTDPPGEALTHKLTLELVRPDGKRLGGNDDNALGEPIPDVTNNAQIVRVADAAPGVYRLVVRFEDGRAVRPQDYALVAHGHLASDTLTPVS
jgi:serine protease AprX